MSTDGRPPAFKAIGISLAVASGLFIGVSFVLKKVGLLKANAKYNEEAGEGYGYLKNAYWWSGMTLMIIGEICNFVAYAFVDAILVTPLGALSVVVTTILSAIFLKEKLSFVGKVSCFLCIVGSVIIVVNAPEQSSVKDIQAMKSFFITPGFLSYAGVIIVGCVCVALFVAPRWGKKSMLVYLTICSLIGGLSVVSIQGLGAAVTAQAGGEQQFNQWFLYVLLVFVICTLVTEIIYLNKALNIFNAALVTPTYYVYFTSATIVSSSVLFQGFNGTPIQIITIVFGFLVICSGVVLLQLAKSSKDVPESQVFTGDFNDIRTIAEQEQPESEPKADALRGTAAIVRRLSLSRQKWEEEEARRVQEDKLRDQLEPLKENEQVEWDGLRRRKTVRTQPSDLSRRQSVHPPLGMAHFPSFEEEIKDTSILPTLRSPSFMQRSRNNSSISGHHGAGAFSHRPDPPPIPEDGEFDLNNKGGRLHANSAESHEMTHVYGLPPELAKSHGTKGRSRSSTRSGKPIQWASDEGVRPETGKSSNPTLAPPTPRSGNRRQFSFQNMFGRGSTRGEESPSLAPWAAGSSNVRSPGKEVHGPTLKGATEEERLGLVKGDSRRPSADLLEEEKSNSSGEGALAPGERSLPKKLRKASHSDAAMHQTSQGYVQTQQQAPPQGPVWSSSSPDVRVPPPNRPLPTPPEYTQTQRAWPAAASSSQNEWPSQDQMQAINQQRGPPSQPPVPPHGRRPSQPGSAHHSQANSRRGSPERIRVVTETGAGSGHSTPPRQQRPGETPRQGSVDHGGSGPGGAAFI